MTDFYPSPPSPELDALAAKAIGRETRSVPDGHGGLVWEERCADGVWHPLTAYSTTGNGMLTIIEWVTATERQWDIKIYAEFNTLLSKHWHACIKSKKRQFYSYTDTAPHAVALAVVATLP